MFDIDNTNLPLLYDELPLWSAPFGYLLLNTVKLGKNFKVLDIGSGCGFPAIELAQRLGNSSKIYCIEPWQEGVAIIKRKINLLNLSNITVNEKCAENLDYSDSFFDLIISNNGINNVQNPRRVLSECYRTAKNGSQLVLTANLPETFIEFYSVFEYVLSDMNKFEEIDKLKNHIQSKRKTIEQNVSMIEQAGFKLNNVLTDKFYYKFIDANAFFSYYFIKVAFLEHWINIVKIEDRQMIFDAIIQTLNVKAENDGELIFTVPYACYKSFK